MRKKGYIFCELCSFLLLLVVQCDLTVCYKFFQGINHFHQTPDREWFETDAVLRVSLGNFLFFTILAIFMIGVKNQKDPRDSLHHGGWMMKIICWCILVILMFFLPNGIVSFYGTFYVYGPYYVYVPIIVLSPQRSKFEFLMQFE